MAQPARRFAPTETARSDDGRVPAHGGVEGSSRAGSGASASSMLVDGSRVAIRRASARDAAALRAFYRGLSPETLHRRFMAPVPRLPESMLAYLCDVGRLDREVLLAIACGELIGEGRYHRVSGTDEAEVALVVADPWQGRGLGRLLADQLAVSAARRGITALGGVMLADNDVANRLLRRTAPGAVRSIRAGEMEFRAALPTASVRPAGSIA